MGLMTDQLTSQRDFLIQNVILLRSKTLQNKLSKEESGIIAKQVDRLIASQQMGLLFKVLCAWKQIWGNKRLLIYLRRTMNSDAYINLLQ